MWKKNNQKQTNTLSNLVFYFLFFPKSGKNICNDLLFKFQKLSHEDAYLVGIPVYGLYIVTPFFPNFLSVCYEFVVITTKESVFFEITMPLKCPCQYGNLLLFTYCRYLFIPSTGTHAGKMCVCAQACVWFQHSAIFKTVVTSLEEKHILTSAWDKRQPTRHHSSELLFHVILHFK